MSEPENIQGPPLQPAGPAGPQGPGLPAYSLEPAVFAEQGLLVTPRWLIGPTEHVPLSPVRKARVWRDPRRSQLLGAALAALFAIIPCLQYQLTSLAVACWAVFFLLVIAGFRTPAPSALELDGPDGTTRVLHGQNHHLLQRVARCINDILANRWRERSGF